MAKNVSAGAVRKLRHHRFATGAFFLTDDDVEEIIGYSVCFLANLFVLLKEEPIQMLMEGLPRIIHEMIESNYLNFCEIERSLDEYGEMLEESRRMIAISANPEERFVVRVEWEKVRAQLLTQVQREPARDATRLILGKILAVHIFKRGDDKTND